ncbi:MAG: UDP-glucose 4-epimerase GalE [Pseudomonadota bacterium]
MSSRVLLTGGAGYIGAHTYVALLDAGFLPVILDNFHNADRDTPDRLARITGQAVRVVEADLLDKSALATAFDNYQFDAVVHFAAKKAVGQSVREPLDYIENNCVGLVNLLKAMEVSGTGVMVFSSSATVYGAPEVLPIPETAPLSFANPYGFTKLMGEQILDQIARVHPDWAIGVLRYFNPAGAHDSGLLRQSPRNWSHPPENLMPRLLDAAHGRIEHLSVYGDDYDTPDGTGVRDYIHITDLARGHVLSLQSLLSGQGGHVANLGTGQGYSVLDMIKTYESVTNQKVPYKIEPRRTGDIAICYADVSRARGILGFEAEHGLADMCRSSQMDCVQDL